MVATDVRIGWKSDKRCGRILAMAWVSSATYRNLGLLGDRAHLRQSRVRRRGARLGRVALVEEAQVRIDGTHCTHPCVHVLVDRRVQYRAHDGRRKRRRLQPFRELRLASGLCRKLLFERSRRVLQLLDVLRRLIELRAKGLQLGVHRVEPRACGADVARHRAQRGRARLARAILRGLDTDERIGRELLHRPPRGGRRFRERRSELGHGRENNGGVYYQLQGIYQWRPLGVGCAKEDARSVLGVRCLCRGVSSVVSSLAHPVCGVSA